jgi:ribonuclease HI
MEMEYQKRRKEQELREGLYGHERKIWGEGEEIKVKKWKAKEDHGPGIECIWKGKKEKKKEVEKIIKRKKEEGYTICYIDGSNKKDMNAAAITYRPNRETKQSTERVPKKRRIIDCEIIAMILAIEHNQEENKLLIMSDNQMALEYWEYPKKKAILAHHNERLFKVLRKFEGKIQSSYIPAHTGIEGNEQADEAAKSPTQMEPKDDEATIPYIKEQPKKRRKEPWSKWFDEKKHEYDQRPNTKTYHRLKNQRWKDTSIILRLKSNN